MNRKQLILLLAALIVIGGAGLALRHRNQESWSSSGSKLGQKVLPNFQVNDVASLRIKGETEVTLVNKNDLWHVRERNDYPANFSQIKELLLKMEDLKIAQAEPIGQSQMARMHLAEGGGPDSATLVEFKDAHDKVLDALLLGKKHTRKSSRPAGPYGDSEMPDGRFILLKSSPDEMLTVSDALADADPKPAEWLNKDFFKIEKAKSISFTSTNAAESWVLARATEATPWIFANVKKGEVFDTNKVTSMGATMESPSFVDVAADAAPAKTGLDKPLALTISTFENFTYTLKIGAKTLQNNYYLTVAVAADFPKERTAGKDEKPEYKKTADKEFQDKLKQFQDKLKQEKSLEPWTYLVSSWLVDPLIRTRAQFMVGKKDEKNPAKKTTGEKPDAGDLFPPTGANDQ